MRRNLVREEEMTLTEAEKEYKLHVDDVYVDRPSMG